MTPAGRLLQPLARSLSALATPALALAALALGATLPSSAEAKESNAAQEALAEFNGKQVLPQAIENRFFLKANRFEVAPTFGYVPNNSFVDNPVGGVHLAYHFSEQVAVEGAFLYAPFLGNAGVKNLTKTLLDIAYQGDPNTTFQQPLDSLQGGAAFSLRYAPVYGKINLIGEGVINFDVYGTAGLGLLLIRKDVAVVSEDYKSGVEGADPVSLISADPAAAPALNLGVGLNFFLSQSISLKLDARTLAYIGKEADYGNIDPQTGQPEALDTELQSQFVTTAGVSIFVPKMKSRAFNF
ncbi:MAG: outer membrane beta-barrel domain-containing protein [Deltaproteobacteria bacterium]|nr:outer membrane beta-barrel domain-containing protein [Deltaproteobacteria bacterium]